MKSTVGPALGEGVYTPSDAAKILRIPVSKVWRWVGTGEEGTWIIDGWSLEGTRGLNFLALVELFVVEKLRGLRVPMQRIRLARELLANRFDTPFPFALRGLLSDGKSILIQLEGQDKSSALRLDGSDQIAFAEIVLEFCKRIDFDPETELADMYWPLGKGRSVVVDPHHAFGQPRIDGTNIPTETIVSMILAGDTVATVASVYNLEQEEVRDAVEFERQLAA